MPAAHAQLVTPNALRYLKALCNHFDRKATGSYQGNRGHVTFEFGTCELEARAGALHLRIAANSPDDFARVTYVVTDHVERFGANENLRVVWQHEDA